jgi:hypothetical protein
MANRLCYNFARCLPSSMGTELVSCLVVRCFGTAKTSSLAFVSGILGPSCSHAAVRSSTY